MKRFVHLLLVLAVFSFLTVYINHNCRSTFHETQHLSYSTCTDGSIPYVTGMLETAQYLLLTNKSIARIADGEVNIILGRSTNYQYADNSLGRALLEVLHSNRSNLLIGIPNIFSGISLMSKEHIDWWAKNDFYRQWYLQNAQRERQYFDALVTSSYIQTIGTGCSLVGEIYRTLREMWKDKELVILRGNNGQKYKYDVFDTASSQKIIWAPARQAWTSYLRLKEELLLEDQSKLFILMIGPVATILAYDLARLERRALDLGHIAKDYDYYMQSLDEGSFWRD